MVCYISDVSSTLAVQLNSRDDVQLERRLFIMPYHILITVLFLCVHEAALYQFSDAAVAACVCQCASERLTLPRISICQ